MTRAQRHRAARQAILVAFGVIVSFAVFGQQLLAYMHISLAGAAGFGRAAAAPGRDGAADGQRRRAAALGERERQRRARAAGTPLLAGPGAIVATMVFVQQSDSLPPTGSPSRWAWSRVHVCLWLAMRFAGRRAPRAQGLRHHAGDPDRRSAPRGDRRPARGGRGASPSPPRPEAPTRGGAARDRGHRLAPVCGGPRLTHDGPGPSSDGPVPRPVAAAAPTGARSTRRGRRAGRAGAGDRRARPVAPDDAGRPCSATARRRVPRGRGLAGFSVALARARTLATAAGRSPLLWSPRPSRSPWPLRSRSPWPLRSRSPWPEPCFLPVSPRSSSSSAPRPARVRCAARQAALGALGDVEVREEVRRGGVGLDRLGDAEVERLVDQPPARACRPSRRT